MKHRFRYITKNSHIKVRLEKFQPMPPSKKYNQVVRNHIMNHRVPKGTKTAVFIFTPRSINSASCPISWMLRSNAEIELQRNPKGRRRSSSLFVTCWSIKAELIFEAIRSIKSHILKSDHSRINVIIFFYAHACPGYFDFDGVLIPTRKIVLACNQVTGLKVLGLLGCNSGSVNLPKPAGYFIFGFNAEVDFNHLSRFAAAFVDYFCDIRATSRYSASSCATSAVRSSYSVLITKDVVVTFK